MGKFDYLKEYCEVVYLLRTEGVSSSEIRKEKRSLVLGLVGTSQYINRVASESAYVNGIKLSGLCADNLSEISDEVRSLPTVTENYQSLLNVSDALYIHSHPQKHYLQIKEALMQGKHVLCESPIALKKEQRKGGL